MAARPPGYGRWVNRDRLQARYRELVQHTLPRLGRDGRWAVVNDHCFGRILLDHAVGRCWYDVLDRRRSPAFAQLTDDQLAAAVALGERIAEEGDLLLRQLNAQSLRWRGKRVRPSR
ncbi:hypothetical protein LV457_13615 [Mycobacterium sp. MYCO198283]|uniref:hypothetical protein n=1 Tax=Mycobacterium sp. MYCO198283 TaxID=2883505 RepID=UPI001E35B324|nr:hypothetical protein [Mycobacterium sp. MYCO198283]MCG5433316.1 hypothetical protein [Mycobacterium sp. MYCO198283]